MWGPTVFNLDYLQLYLQRQIPRQDNPDGSDAVQEEGSSQDATEADTAGAESIATEEAPGKWQ